jgi:hypothetical protein
MSENRLRGLEGLYGLVPPTPAPPKRPSAMAALVRRAMLNRGLFRTRNGEEFRFGLQQEIPVDSYGDIGAMLTALGVGSDDPGVYAVMDTRSDRVLYFGQAKAMTERVTGSHEHYYDWCREAGGAANLRVKFYHMPNSTEPQRVALERSLIEYYNPPCNVQFNRLRHAFGF